MATHALQYKTEVMEDSFKNIPTVMQDNTFQKFSIEEKEHSLSSDISVTGNSLEILLSSA
jgi:hypothetical protein